MSVEQSVVWESAGETEIRDCHINVVLLIYPDFFIWITQLKVLKEEITKTPQTSLHPFFKKKERIKRPESQPSKSGISKAKHLHLLVYPPSSPTGSSDPDDTLLQ
jgi:hypothetical protein